jgi:segregation and condensation protein A
VPDLELPPLPFVKLQLFEGPLDLLLHLCRRHELEITELAISEVTEQFLAYLEVLGELKVEVAGEFVEMAALLCLLKSREMLPAIDVPGDDEDEEGEDPRARLIERLLDYKRYREAAQELDAVPRPGRDVFVRGLDPLVASGLQEEDMPVEADMTALLSALRDLLEARSRGEPIHAVADPALSLAVRMRTLLELIAAGPKAGVSFARLFDDDRSRAMVSVSFLAILELARLRHIRLVQEAHLQRLRLVRRFEGAPPIMEGHDGS